MPNYRIKMLNGSEKDFSQNDIDNLAKSYNMSSDQVLSILSKANALSSGSGDYYPKTRPMNAPRPIQYTPSPNNYGMSTTYFERPREAPNLAGGSNHYAVTPYLANQTDYSTAAKHVARLNRIVDQDSQLHPEEYDTSGSLNSPGKIYSGKQIDLSRGYDKNGQPIYDLSGDVPAPSKVPQKFVEAYNYQVPEELPEKYLSRLYDKYGYRRLTDDDLNFSGGLGHSGEDLKAMGYKVGDLYASEDQLNAPLNVPPGHLKIPDDPSLPGSPLYIEQNGYEQAMRDRKIAMQNGAQVWRPLRQGEEELYQDPRSSGYEHIAAANAGPMVDYSGPQQNRQVQPDQASIKAVGNTIQPTYQQQDQNNSGLDEYMQNRQRLQHSINPYSINSELINHVKQQGGGYPEAQQQVDRLNYAKAHQVFANPQAYGINNEDDMHVASQMLGYTKNSRSNKIEPYNTQTQGSYKYFGPQSGERGIDMQTGQSSDLPSNQFTGGTAM